MKYLIILSCLFMVGCVQETPLVRKERSADYIIGSSFNAVGQGYSSGAIAIGDLNGDSKNDIVFINSNNQVEIVINKDQWK